MMATRDDEQTNDKATDAEAPRIGDNPTFRKQAELLSGLVVWKRALPFLKPFAWLLGADVASLKDALSSVENLRMQHREMSALPDAFNDLFATRGWIIYDLMNLTVVRAAIKLAQEESIEAAERRLVEYYSHEEVRRLLGTMKHIDAFRDRMPLALKALDDYEAQRFHACVPVVLALADGMVNQVSAGRRGFSAEKTDLSAWDSIAAHERGLNTLKSIFMKGRQTTTTEPLTIPYRNGILHGMDLGYDNALVAAKTWGALFALRDWAIRAERKQLQAPPPEQPASLRETLQQAMQIDERTREIAEWKAREIRVGVDVAPRGPLNAYRQGSAEHCLYQFLSLWQCKNYGHMTRSLRAFGGKPIRPSEVRGQFEWRTLIDFEFVSVKDAAAAICEITVKRTIERSGSKVEDVVAYRLSHENDSGQPVVVSDPAGKWAIVMWII